MDQHILVPFDGSTLAEGMLAHVQALAKSLGAELVFLRVALTHIFPAADGIQAQVAAVQEAADYVSGLASRLQAEEVRAEVKECYGDPAEEILDHVAKEYIHLIAMATLGRTGLTRFLIRSVAKYALRRTAGPMLLCAALPEEA